MASNTLWVVQGHDHPWLQSRSLVAMDATWISGTPASDAGTPGAKTRYRQADAPCRMDTDPDTPARFALDFAQPQWAVTPGQSAVVYDGDVCLGGGVIHTCSALG